MKSSTGNLPLKQPDLAGESLLLGKTPKRFVTTVFTAALYEFQLHCQADSNTGE